MLKAHYKEKSEALFTGRIPYLSRIDENVAKGRHTLILAQSGHGRESLLKNSVAKGNAFYLDLRKLSLSPENFAVEFVSNVCFFNLAKDHSELRDYQQLSDLRKMKVGKRCIEKLDIIDNELQKIKPDQSLLLRSAISFAEDLAVEQDKRSFIALNNFEEILKFNNFSQISDSVGLFFSAIAHNKKCSFVLSSPAIFQMKRLLEKYDIDTIEVAPLTVDETRELFTRIAGKADDRIIKEVHAQSAGIPVVISSIASRFKEEKTADVQKNISLIRYILVSELATKSSLPYFYCKKLFTESLNRARGESLLRNIVKVMASNTPLRLTEIAHRIYRSGPVTKSLLERLIEVDLVVKHDKVFDFANPVLKEWCRLMFGNTEFNETPDEDTLREFGALV
jgi:hypothetical protein